MNGVYHWLFSLSVNNRKFFLTLLFSVAGVVGFFTNDMTASEFITFSTFILGIYGGANVLQKVGLKNAGANELPSESKNTDRRGDPSSLGGNSSVQLQSEAKE